MQAMGVLDSLRAGRRNVLELIPDLATHAPILSVANCWTQIADMPTIMSQGRI